MSMQKWWETLTTIDLFEPRRNVLVDAFKSAQKCQQKSCESREKEARAERQNWTERETFIDS